MEAPPEELGEEGRLPVDRSSGGRARTEGVVLVVEVVLHRHRLGPDHVWRGSRIDVILRSIHLRRWMEQSARGAPQQLFSTFTSLLGAGLQIIPMYTSTPARAAASTQTVALAKNQASVLCAHSKKVLYIASKIMSSARKAVLSRFRWSFRFVASNKSTKEVHGLVYTQRVETDSFRNDEERAGEDCERYARRRIQNHSDK
mmetsp:Transcript_5047/g.12751  ORF Transcript_5047/g.12751 Transcript_5047/m.12751 type:complete len:201 (+) Transcript_5047:3729-4331(+)